MRKLDCDVLIIGAGISGLTAFNDLSREGLNVICLEARDRIGGRILTINDPHSPLPVELGPEFVHGRPPETWDLVRLAKLALYDCKEHSSHIRHGKADGHSDAWEQVDQITEEMKRVAATGADPSFFEFIHQVQQPQSAKDLATSYVEGFNAAHKERISVASLAQDAEAAEKIDGDRTFRIATGYKAIPEFLLQTSAAGDTHVRLNSVVNTVHWKPGHARVEARSSLTDAPFQIESPRVITTVPLGVLTARENELGRILFDPIPLEFTDALQSLEFGHVTRLVFRFKERWWENQEHLFDAGFWLSDERFFPTWWTTLPMRTPLLTGWSAGPHTDELLGQPKSLLVARAFEDLSRISKVKTSDLQEQLDAVHYHDWHGDPFSRGAYSYVRAGSFGKRAALALPVANTLFFAGEATEVNGHGGTVHGARATGHRSARQVIESFR